jgi:ADP-ribosyl-[dinitrogen reductase] hydrolase
LGVSPHREKVPSPALEHQRDRAIGCLLGLAVGDAVGTTLEFTERGTFEPLTNMVGGGPFRLPPGGWTDDTSMALALARSLLANSELDEADLMNRFVAWRRRGEYSWNGRCFDIGMTVSAALQRFESTGNPVAGSIDPLCAGNGSIMRLAPVAIRHRNAADRLLDVARRQSATTHGAQEAVSACELLAEMLVGAINGEPRSRVLRDRSADYAGSVGSIARGGWRGKTRGEIQSTGYVAHTLEAALWCVGRTGSFREAVLLGANLGGDADTTAAVVGQIAGALYGASSIPREWIEQLQWRDEIAALGAELYEHSNR